MFNGRQTEISQTIIENDSFWGNVSVGEFQQNRQIPLQIPETLMQTALIGAMAALELDLAEVAKKYQQQGFQTSADINGAQINGENQVQHLYKKALFARAKHDLLPEFQTMSARELHEKRNIVEEQKTLLTEATMAIRALKGKRRGSVCLI